MSATVLTLWSGGFSKTQQPAVKHCETISDTASDHETHGLRVIEVKTIQKPSRHLSLNNSHNSHPGDLQALLSHNRGSIVFPCAGDSDCNQNPQKPAEQPSSPPSSDSQGVKQAEVHFWGILSYKMYAYYLIYIIRTFKYL
jgi:hypothetical protein